MAERALENERLSFDGRPLGDGRFFLYGGLCNSAVFWLVPIDGRSASVADRAVVQRLWIHGNYLASVSWCDGGVGRAPFPDAKKNAGAAGALGIVHLFFSFYPVVHAASDDALCFDAMRRFASGGHPDSVGGGTDGKNGPLGGFVPFVQTDQGTADGRGTLGISDGNGREEVVFAPLSENGRDFRTVGAIARNLCARRRGNGNVVEIESGAMDSGIGTAIHFHCGDFRRHHGGGVVPADASIGENVVGNGRFLGCEGIA